MLYEEPDASTYSWRLHLFVIYFTHSAISTLSALATYGKATISITDSVMPSLISIHIPPKERLDGVYELETFVRQIAPRNCVCTNFYSV